MTNDEALKILFEHYHYCVMRIKTSSSKATSSGVCDLHYAYSLLL